MKVTDLKNSYPRVICIVGGSKREQDHTFPDINPDFAATLTFIRSGMEQMQLNHPSDRSANGEQQSSPRLHVRVAVQRNGSCEPTDLDLSPFSSDTVR